MQCKDGIMLNKTLNKKKHFKTKNTIIEIKL